MGGEMYESEMYIQDSKTLSTPTTGKSIDKLMLNSKNHGYVMKGFALEAGGALKLLNLGQPAEVEAGSKLINPVSIKLAIRESQLNEDKSSVDASHYEHWGNFFDKEINQGQEGSYILSKGDRSSKVANSRGQDFHRCHHQARNQKQLSDQISMPILERAKHRSKSVQAPLSMTGMKALTTFLCWGWIKSRGSLGYSDTVDIN